MDNVNNKFLTNYLKDLILVKQLPKSLLRFLILRQCTFTTIFNFLLNVAIAYFFFRRTAMINMMGITGFLFDLILCILLTSVLNALDAAQKVEKALKKKLIYTLHRMDNECGIVKHLSKKTMFRSFQMSLIYALVMSGFLVSDFV